MWKTKEKKQRANLYKIDTLLGKNTVMMGDLRFSGGLQLDGIIRGNVTSEEGTNAVLVIGENGRVEGEVHVANVIIRGQVVGPVYATNTLELASSSSVIGDIFYNQIEVIMGAKLNGNMVCMQEKPLQGELIHEKIVESVEPRITKAIAEEVV